MTCECRFDLYSAKPEIFSVFYSWEEYKMPCIDAAAFLKHLDSAYRFDKYPQHKVDYTINDGQHNYQSKVSETPAKAAAKIELFMKNPNLMPKK